MDPAKNNVKVKVSGTYDETATSIDLSSGDGDKLPDPSADGEFNLLWWNLTDYSDPADDPNAEYVRVTDKSDDTLTVQRPDSDNDYNGEGSENTATTKNESGKTYRMILTFSKKVHNDVSYADKTENFKNKTINGDDNDISNIGLDEIKTEVLAASYPVGSLYFNATDDTNPSTLLGFGTWEEFGAGRVPVGYDSGDSDFDTAEKTGGAKTIDLSHGHTVNSHSHTVNSHSHGSGSLKAEIIAGNNKIMMNKIYTGFSYNFKADVSGDESQSGSIDAASAVTGSTSSSSPGTSSSSPGTNSKLSSTQSILQPFITVYIWKRTE